MNVFKSLNYFKLNNFEAAGVEIRRVNEKLILLQDKYNKLASEMNNSMFYQIDLKLINMANNRIEWVGDKKIRRKIERSRWTL